MKHLSLLIFCLVLSPMTSFGDDAVESELELLAGLDLGMEVLYLADRMYPDHYEQMKSSFEVAYGKSYGELYKQKYDLLAKYEHQPIYKDLKKSIDSFKYEILIQSVESKDNLSRRDNLLEARLAYLGVGIDGSEFDIPFTVDDHPNIHSGSYYWNGAFLESKELEHQELYGLRDLRVLKDRRSFKPLFHIAFNNSSRYSQKVKDEAKLTLSALAPLFSIDELTLVLDQSRGSTDFSDMEALAFKASINSAWDEHSDFLVEGCDWAHQNDLEAADGFIWTGVIGGKRVFADPFTDFWQLPSFFPRMIYGIYATFRYGIGGAPDAVAGLWTHGAQGLSGEALGGQLFASGMAAFGVRGLIKNGGIRWANPPKTLDSPPIEPGSYDSGNGGIDVYDPVTGLRGWQPWNLNLESNTTNSWSTPSNVALLPRTTPRGTQGATLLETEPALAVQKPTLGNISLLETPPAMTTGTQESVQNPPKKLKVITHRDSKGNPFKREYLFIDPDSDLPLTVADKGSLPSFDYNEDQIHHEQDGNDDDDELANGGGHKLGADIRRGMQLIYYLKIIEMKEEDRKIKIKALEIIKEEQGQKAIAGLVNLLDWEGNQDVRHELAQTILEVLGWEGNKKPNELTSEDFVQYLITQLSPSLPHKRRQLAAQTLGQFDNNRANSAFEPLGKIVSGVDPTTLSLEELLIYRDALIAHMNIYSNSWDKKIEVKDTQYYLEINLAGVMCAYADDRVPLHGDETLGTIFLGIPGMLQTAVPEHSQVYALMRLWSVGPTARVIPAFAAAQRSQYQKVQILAGRIIQYWQDTGKLDSKSIPVIAHGKIPGFSSENDFRSALSLGLSKPVPFEPKSEMPKPKVGTRPKDQSSPPEVRKIKETLAKIVGFVKDRSIVSHLIEIGKLALTLEDYDANLVFKSALSYFDNENPLVVKMVSRVCLIILKDTPRASMAHFLIEYKILQNQRLEILKILAKAGTYKDAPVLIALIQRMDESDRGSPYHDGLDHALRKIYRRSFLNQKAQDLGILTEIRTALLLYGVGTSMDHLSITMRGWVPFLEATPKQLPTVPFERLNIARTLENFRGAETPEVWDLVYFAFYNPPKFKEICHQSLKEEEEKRKQEDPDDFLLLSRIASRHESSYSLRMQAVRHFNQMARLQGFEEGIGRGEEDTFLYYLLEHSEDAEEIHSKGNIDMTLSDILMHLRTARKKGSDANSSDLGHALLKLPAEQMPEFFRQLGSFEQWRYLMDVGHIIKDALIPRYGATQVAEWILSVLPNDLPTTKEGMDETSVTSIRAMFLLQDMGADVVVPVLNELHRRALILKKNMGEINSYPLPLIIPLRLKKGSDPLAQVLNEEMDALIKELSHFYEFLDGHFFGNEDEANQIVLAYQNVQYCMAAIRGMGRESFERVLTFTNNIQVSPPEETNISPTLLLLARIIASLRFETKYTLLEEYYSYPETSDAVKMVIIISMIFEENMEEPGFRILFQALEHGTPIVAQASSDAFLYLRGMAVSKLIENIDRIEKVREILKELLTDPKLEPGYQTMIQQALSKDEPK